MFCVFVSLALKRAFCFTCSTLYILVLWFVLSIILHSLSLSLSPSLFFPRLICQLPSASFQSLFLFVCVCVCETQRVGCTHFANNSNTKKHTITSKGYYTIGKIWGQPPVQITFLEQSWISWDPKYIASSALCA